MSPWIGIDNRDQSIVPVGTIGFFGACIHVAPAVLFDRLFFREIPGLERLAPLARGYIMSSLSGLEEDPTRGGKVEARRQKGTSRTFSSTDIHVRTRAGPVL